MTPKYQRVTDWIRERIASGDLKEGDRIESEHQLSDRFEISRQTVRHALGILVQQGVLSSRQGSGTYVSEALSLPPRKKTQKELSRTVTIISTYVDGYIFLRILQAMASTLEQADYSVRIMFTRNRLELERKLLKKLLEEDCRDALIVEPVMSGLPSPNVKYYRELRERGIPILFFHSFYPELDIPHVGMDDVAAGRIAAEYLISRGHTRIGGIFKTDDGQGQRRYKGYLEALYKAQIEVIEDQICLIDTNQLNDFQENSPRIWQRLKGCTACVCYNDQVGHALTESALKIGIRIPEDLSIVSIDNSELARLNPVPLTSVSHPM